jgi:Zn-dependent protease with chaperone function
MDFFGWQDRARRRTSWLVAYFALAVAGTLAALYVAVVVVLSMSGSLPRMRPGRALRAAYGEREAVRPAWWHPGLFAGVTTVCGAVMLGVAGVRMLQLRGGGDAVARSLGARPVAPDSTDPGERRLRNVVEEMAIAAGIAVPAVYVMDDEPGINAFAAGYSPDHAVVCVTRGALQTLARDELQGVVGHEFSHILNGDMRLNVRLVGFISGILAFMVLGRILLRSAGRGRSRSKGGGQIAVAGILLMLIGWAGALFARLIQSAVSRQREYLADASAVQFTRNPTGLAGALKKIGGWPPGSRLSHPRAEEMSHLFFGDGVARAFGTAFATHPPLVARIRRLDPDFNGGFERIVRPVDRPEGRVAAACVAPPARAAEADRPARERAYARLTPSKAVDAIGAPVHAHLAAASSILSSMPEAVRVATRDPDGAAAVVGALLLSADVAVRAKQLAAVQETLGEAARARVEGLAPAVAALPREARLPLVQLSLPALRNLPPDGFRALLGAVDRMVQADQSVDLFEYALSRVLVQTLERHFEKRPPPAASVYGLRGVAADLSVLLTALARSGADDPAAAKAAFAHGAASLGADAAYLQYVDGLKAEPARIDGALRTLARLSAPLKKQVIEAGLRTIARDGTISAEESEVFRAVSAALDVPVPLWAG